MDDEIMINGVKYHRVVEAEPIRVGDWVEAINDGTLGLVKPGAKGIVQKPSNVGFWVKWKSGEFESCFDNEWSIKIANLRKIDPPAPAPERKFKVGDWVRSTEGLTHYYAVGDVGRIEKYDDVPGAVWVKFEKYDFLCRGWEHWFELAPATAPLKYKPGDIVLVPVRVVEVDENDKFQPYKVLVISDTVGFYRRLSRAALEPPEPQEGQRVIGWYCCEGELTKDDKSKHPYRVEYGDEYDWCDFAVAIE